MDIHLYREIGVIVTESTNIIADMCYIIGSYDLFSYDFSKASIRTEKLMHFS